MEQFFTLTPERILGAVERALGSDKTGVRATGRCLALNSMENRVYELEMDDESRVVTKFYRPGRWTREMILEEHGFLAELIEAEIPAVAPLPLTNSSTLAESEDGIFFAVFPKVRGRIVQELDDARLQQVGRLLARLHNIGASRAARHRLALTPATYGRKSLEFLDASGMIDHQLRARYRNVVEAILTAIEPQFANVPSFRVHGDCHLGNVLWQENAAFFLDFDDMVMAPAVQDVWLIVRGRDEEAQRQREVLIRSYESMREFDRSALRLIEPLRALRIMHYSAWIARRWEDPTFKNAFPDFGSYKYWFEELAELDEQLRLVSAPTWT
ncbi:MAG: serine/threonine protein kinase [Deltaproteobacteria bacterium]|nr:serine/threonine protein kinase [Deltaproteobacteria bacterium]